jgi:hypothetical protein
MFDFSRPANGGDFVLDPSTGLVVHGGHDSGW